MGRWDQYRDNKRIGNASAAWGALQGEEVPPVQPARSHLHSAENKSAGEVPAPWPTIKDENTPELQQDKQTSLAYWQDNTDRGAKLKKMLIAD